MKKAWVDMDVTERRVYRAALYNDKGEKRCAKCGVFKPLSEYKLKRERPNGRCRECEWSRRALEKKRAYARKRGGVLDERDKTCVCCKEKLPVIKFSRRQTDGVNLFPWCMVCGRDSKNLSKMADLVPTVPEIAVLAAETMIRSAKTSCFRRGLFCTLVPSDLLPMPSHCPILSIKLDYRGRLASFSKVWSQSHKAPDDWHETSASLDRIYPDGDYMPGNVVVISNKINSLKSNLSLVDIKRLLIFYQNTITP